MITPDIITRKANLQDRDQVWMLLQKESFIHRHLGWQPPLAWLEKQPYLVQLKENTIISVLACPPDEDGTTWLRLFAVAPGYSVSQAWESLWYPALDWLQNHNPVTWVNALVVQNELESILKKTGFTRGYQVIVLVWDITQAKWPEWERAVKIRSMKKEDFPRVYEVDQEAFEPIWRISRDQLKIAFTEACFATIAQLENHIIGYQISTRNPQAGHLARLAVTPRYQNQGTGSALVRDTLDRFQRQGVVQVTVNTQVRNQSSLNLYKKFGFQRRDEIYPVYQYNLDK